MSTITKESVAGIASGEKCYTHDDVVELARIALASLEAEAAAYIIQDSDARGRGEKGILRYFANISDEDINEYEITVTPLYTAPPATVSVPDEITFEKIAEITASQGYEYSINECICAASWWNACRAAMLQGAETAESRCSDSPVLPEGWVMVPVEPTEDMIVNGFESEPDESFSDEKEWATYDAMSGCQQAAHRAKLCWSAMISAAPKPDVR